MGAFCDDTFLAAEFKKLVDQHGVKTIIETGTYLGDTTPALAKLVPTVHTIEVNADYFDRSAKRLSTIPNITRHFGSSPAKLAEIFKTAEQPMLLFLDAHWYSYCPLLDELAVVAEAKMKPIIIIHDFKSPNNPNLGFDMFGDQEYNWDLISKHVHAIYGDNVTVSYNTEATGARRGAIFLIPNGS